MTNRRSQNAKNNTNEEKKWRTNSIKCWRLTLRNIVSTACTSRHDLANNNFYHGTKNCYPSKQIGNHEITIFSLNIYNWSSCWGAKFVSFYGVGQRRSRIEGQWNWMHLDYKLYASGCLGCLASRWVRFKSTYCVAIFTFYTRSWWLLRCYITELHFSKFMHFPTCNHLQLWLSSQIFLT